MSRSRPPVARVGDVAAAMDLLALALRGGRSVMECLAEVAELLDDPLRGQLRSVSAALAWGLAEDEAWSRASAAWRPTARALALAAEAGVPPAGLLAGAAADLRRAEESRLEEADARLGIHIVIPLGLLFLPAFVVSTVLPMVVALAAQTLRH